MSLIPAPLSLLCWVPALSLLKVAYPQYMSILALLLMTATTAQFLLAESQLTLLLLECPSLARILLYTQFMIQAATLVLLLELSIFKMRLLLLFLCSVPILSLLKAVYLQYMLNLVPPLMTAVTALLQVKLSVTLLLPLACPSLARIL